MAFLAVLALGLAGIALWLAIILRWRWGLIGLLLYLPFAGIISLTFHPNKLPLIFKDIAFVLPAYLSFFAFHARELRTAPIPRPVAWAIGSLTILVLLQTLNPGVVSWMVAVIGVKVWLFYIPIVFLAAAYFRDIGDVVTLLRALVALSVVPCAIGVLQWLGSIAFGYEAVMTGFYGEAARGATQGFASHSYGALLYRIPSTFSFVSQYFGYTFGMVVFGYCLIRLDPHPAWRKFGQFMMAFFVLASALSGARGAYVFIPLLLVTITLLDQKLSGVFAVVVLVPVIILVAMSLVGIDPELLFRDTTFLIGHYGREIVYANLIDAFVEYPLGTGTGMNTGAARHAFASESTASSKLLFLENYYAKAMAELGFIGLPAAIAVFVTIIVAGMRIRARLADGGLKGVAAATTAFFVTIAVHSTKGWQIDYDPLNVYFWVFAGLLFKLPLLDPRNRQHEAQRRRVETALRARRAAARERHSP
jgi:hypothetical protein